MHGFFVEGLLIIVKDQLEPHHPIDYIEYIIIIRYIITWSSTDRVDLEQGTFGLLRGETVGAQQGPLKLD